jgi:phosphoribosylaminoimidazole-succinocarboxamide synthase
MKDLVYEGKAKKVFKWDDGNYLLEFKDSLTAFNALKKGSFEEKGSINRDIAALIFEAMAKKKIPTHYKRKEGATGMIVEKVKIIPLEVVIRNTLAGSTAKKLGIEEGRKLKKPLVEFYYKDDALQDPFVSDDQVLMMGIATPKEIQTLKKMGLEINKTLQALFKKIGIELIDFKVEFGKTAKGKIILADEITPDCCRLWDMKTGEKMDKDRFRRDLGNVRESYQEVLKRLLATAPAAGTGKRTGKNK